MLTGSNHVSEAPGLSTVEESTVVNNRSPDRTPTEFRDLDLKRSFVETGRLDSTDSRRVALDVRCASIDPRRDSVDYGRVPREQRQDSVENTRVRRENRRDSIDNTRFSLEHRRDSADHTRIWREERLDSEDVHQDVLDTRRASVEHRRESSQDRRRSSVETRRSSVSWKLGLRALTVTRRLSVGYSLFYDHSSSEDEGSQRMEPTYRIEPTRTFSPGRARSVVDAILATSLKDSVYNPIISRTQACHISDVIKSRLRDLDLPRFKLVCQVMIGQRSGQDVEVASRCLWNQETDNFCTSTFSGADLFAVATVHAVYLD